MSVDMSPPRPAFFSEGISVRSNSSSPPSLKSLSMKGKISFISGLLSRSSSKANIREDVHSKPTRPTPVTDLAEEKVVASPPKMIASTSNSENTKPAARKNTTRRANDALSHSTSKSLAKRISTSFRKPSRSQSPEPAVPRLSDGARHAREAALRERGLLPPKDMSTLEREQDQRLSPVAPAPDTNADGFSAADRIKQEWAARNLAAQAATEGEKSTRPPTQEGLDSPGAPVRVELPSVELETVEEVETPLPSPNEHPLVSSGRLKKSSSRLTLTIAKPPPTYDLPPTPSDPEFAGYFTPLPPSPLDETLSVHSGEISPRIVPLPPSPSPPSSPRSVSSAHHDVSTPKRSDAHPGSPAPPPKLDLLAVVPSPLASPATTPTSPYSYECSEDGALAPPSSRSRSRSRSAATAMASSESDESGSIATPSLDTSSQLTLESAFSHVTHKTKPSALPKTWANEPTVPVIFESPSEEHGLVIPISKSDADLAGGLEEKKVSITEPLKNRNRAQTTAGADAGALNQRRKSLFGKRSVSANAADEQSKSNSLANIRRSIVGTLSRGVHSPPARRKTFDRIPPSPTAPASLAGQSMVSSTSAASIGSGNSIPRGRSAGRTTGVGPRQALSPTIHSRGSILVETNGIEDDESRRMTELAFLN